VPEDHLRMEKRPRRAKDGWITATLAVFALAFALGGRAPAYAATLVLLGGALLWITSRIDRLVYGRILSVTICLIVALAAMLATAAGRT
jgi:hypothetical protein